MSIGGLKSRFLVELLEHYADVFGPSEQERIVGRLSARYRSWFDATGRSAPRPEVLFLDDVEEILTAFEDNLGGSASGSRFESAVEEVVDRWLRRRSLLRSDVDLRSSLSRLIPHVEDLWPIRPPTLTLDGSTRGLRLSLSHSGYSRSTRLLTFQMLGALKAATRLCAGLDHRALRVTVDFFGDRARVDVLLPERELALDETQDSPPSQPPSQRPTPQRVKVPRTSLAEQVESILGHRSSAPSSPINAQPSRPSQLPPDNALGMAQLGRSPRLRESPTLSAPPPSRPSQLPPPSSFGAPRVPVFDHYRRPTPPPDLNSVRLVAAPKVTQEARDSQRDAPANLPESRTRLVSDSPAPVALDPPPPPPSRRGRGGSR